MTKLLEVIFYHQLHVDIVCPEDHITTTVQQTRFLQRLYQDVNRQPLTTRYLNSQTLFLLKKATSLREMTLMFDTF